MKKSTKRINQIIIIMAFTVFCIIVTKTNADQKSFISNTPDITQQFISDHEYIVTPLADTLAGVSLCGSICTGNNLAAKHTESLCIPTCFASTFVAGVIDEALVYLGYFDKRYLSWGLLGAATGNLIIPWPDTTTPNQPSLDFLRPYAASAGAIVGVLVPTGKIDDYTKYFTPLITPIISATAAAMTYGGSPLVIAGGAVLGGIDEMLIYYNVTNKHYLTSLSQGNLFAKKLLAQDTINPISVLVTTVVALVEVGLEQQLKDTALTPINTASKLNELYGKFIPQDQLKSHFDKQRIALVTTQIMSQLINLKSNKLWNPITKNFEELNAGNIANWGSLKSGVFIFAIFLIPVWLGDMTTRLVNNHYDEKLYAELYNRVQKEIYTGQNALSMSYHKNYTAYMDNLEDTLSTIVSANSLVVGKSIGTAIQGAYGLGMVMVYSPKIGVYNALSNMVKDYIAIRSANEKGKYFEKNKYLLADLTGLKKDLKTNIKTIAERDGLNISHEKIANITEEIKENNGAIKLYAIKQEALQGIINIASSLLQYLYLAYEIKEGRVPSDRRKDMMTAGLQISSLFSLPGDIATRSDNINRAINQFTIIENLIHAPTSKTDQIVRIYTDTNYLSMNNLEIGTDTGVLLKIDDLKLEMGKVYAVTGPAGCGKSSLMSKIKGVKDNGVYGKGTISYPMIKGKSAKIVMIGKDYLPLQQTLHEIVAYPNKPPSNPIQKQEQREEIIKLFKETGLDNFISQLDERKDWSQTLSGGETKKLLLISAVFHKPDILILDEIFSRLDEVSVKAVQNLLREVLTKYLTNTLTLVVDHYAENNNYDDFYAERLHIENQKVSLVEI
jgi:ABC-type nitrate/sulfonate/bicarbonate transport system ATPase subunit